MPAGAVNIRGIHGVQKQDPRGFELSDEEVQEAESTNSRDFHKLTEDQYKNDFKTLEAERQQELTEEFLHQTIAVDGFFNALNSASKNQLNSGKKQSITDDALHHITQEAVIDVQVSTTGSAV